MQISLVLVTQIHYVYKQKAVWFVSDVCVSCAFYISTQLTMDACEMLLKFRKCDCNFNIKHHKI